jgi:superfamily I DNA and RNA helicase
MLNVYYGQSDLREQAAILAESLDSAGVTGDLLIGYPLFSDSEQDFNIAAVLNHPVRGVVLFITSKSQSNVPAIIEEQQDSAIFQAKGFFIRSPRLRRKNDLAVSINAISLFPGPPAEDLINCSAIVDSQKLKQIIDSFPPVEEQYRKPLTAALQTVTTIKPVKKRVNAATIGSRGNKIRNIEREISNLDKWQQIAAIECPEGPQRIRGLAGSGKTIVLALKAAYLLATKPYWQIAIIYYSRTLHQQFVDLVRRFYYEQKNDEPDWQRITIMHAWGSPSDPGLYAEISHSLGRVPRTFLSAREEFGSDRAFSGACSELLTSERAIQSNGRYDAILIDEAQDLPASFFRIVYEYIKEPKRITFAYDELQTLSEASMPGLGELFGISEGHIPKVELYNTPGQPRRDIILPHCYRNTPWAIACAHMLGLGIYSQDGIIQHFEDPQIWSEVGYKVKSGILDYDSDIVLSRDRERTPKYFYDLLSEEESVRTKIFKDDLEQYDWVSEQVAKNVSSDELDLDDILIVFIDPRTTPRRSDLLRKSLLKVGIASHVVGNDVSRDRIFINGSVAITHIFRSKGNEAPMVYVLNSEDAINPYRKVSSRNMIFTAVTRSRAWVNLCGVGSQMQQIIDEVETLKRHKFELDFHIPSKKRLAEMKLLSREISPGNVSKIRKTQQAIEEVRNLLESGDIFLEQLPANWRPIFNSDIENGLE